MTIVQCKHYDTVNIGSPGHKFNKSLTIIKGNKFCIQFLIETFSSILLSSSSAMCIVTDLGSFVDVMPCRVLPVQ